MVIGRDLAGPGPSLPAPRVPSDMHGARAARSLACIIRTVSDPAPDRRAPAWAWYAAAAAILVALGLLDLLGLLDGLGP